ncbi:hypothetical protein Trihar35433_2005 [Trichoderma harzianum]|nr:hypothetical protein Trihar35433_2005 [Trichoderma harzianum]
MPTVSSDHLPPDELYDFTPKKAAVPTQQAAAEGRYIDAEAPCCRDPPDVRPNPLVSTEQDDQSFTPMKAVDFSETASTIHGSSSLVGANEPKDIWNFDDSPTDSGPIPETSKEMPTVSSDHSPSDELYDFTPKKATSLTQAAAKPKSS